MPVVTNQGLVGRIDAVITDAARVQLVTDPASTVNIRLQNAEVEATLSGSVTGDVALDRSDPRFVMLGGAGFGHPGPLLRFDQVTEQARDVAVWPEYFMGIGASELKHQCGWTYPIEFSPHEPGVQ